MADRKQYQMEIYVVTYLWAAVADVWDAMDLPNALAAVSRPK